MISMSLDTHEHTRSVYSILDLLGDIGGLYSILYSIGLLIIQMMPYVFGSSKFDLLLQEGIFLG